MADSNKTLKLAIELEQKGDGAQAAAANLKQVTDESARYEAALEAMADKESGAAEGTTGLNKAVREFAEAVKAAKDEMESGGGAFIPDNLAGKIKEVGGAEEELGDKAAQAGLKHMAISRIMSELGHLSPGLGEALGMVSDAYKLAGESAEGGAVGATQFAAAMDEVLLSMGPLVVVSLSIQAAMEYWDLYQEKVKETAEANDQAMQQMAEATKKAFKAVQDLDEALNPKKKDMATHDQDELDKKVKALNEAGQSQKEINRAREQSDLENARSPEEREQIRKRYEQADHDLDEQQIRKKAQLEQQAGDQVAKQIKDVKQAEDQQIEIQKRAYQDKKNAAEEIDRLEKSKADATKQFNEGNDIADNALRGGKVDQSQARFLVALEDSITGQKLTFAQAVKLIEMQSTNAQFQAELLGNAYQRIEAISAQLDQLKAQSAHTGSFHTSG